MHSMRVAETFPMFDENNELTYTLPANPLFSSSIGLIGDISDKITFGRLFLYQKDAIDILNQKVAFIFTDGHKKEVISGNAGAWSFITNKDTTLYNHDGFFPGYSSSIMIAPEFGLGFYTEVIHHKSYVPKMLTNMLFMHYQKQEFDTIRTIRRHQKMDTLFKLNSISQIEEVLFSAEMRLS